MDGMFTILVSIIIISLMAVLFLATYTSIGSMINSMNRIVARETTMMASLNTGGNEYTIEIVWTGTIVRVRYIILANGELVSLGNPIQCGIGYVPAPYRYCIYKVSLPAQPIGVLIGG